MDRMCTWIEPFSSTVTAPTRTSSASSSDMSIFGTARCTKLRKDGRRPRSLSGAGFPKLSRYAGSWCHQVSNSLIGEAYGYSAGDSLLAMLLSATRGTRRGIRSPKRLKRSNKFSITSLTLNSLDESVAGFAFPMAAGVARLTRFSFIGVYVLMTFLPVTLNPWCSLANRQQRARGGTKAAGSPKSIGYEESADYVPRSSNVMNYFELFLDSFSGRREGNANCSDSISAVL